MLSPYLRILRPEQWIKNGFVLAPLIFAEKMLDVRSMILSLAAFGAFCAVSSGVYVFNDIFDREKDLVHPVKKHRPIPSGEIGIGVGGLIGSGLVLGGVLVSFFIGTAFLWTVVGYLALQLTYNVLLRQVVILDILTIAMGFVLRALAGSIVIKVQISPWLILCTLLVALFLGFAKRRQEIVLLGDAVGLHRKVLRDYSLPFLDQLIGIVTAATIVSYAIYTLSPEVTARLGSRAMIMTLPFVIYGMFRYLYLVNFHEKGGSPSKDLLADGPLLLCVLLWGVTSVGLIYG